MPKHDFTMSAAEMAQLLARQAEAVCRHYLPAGRRAGRYWLVGDVHNTPGRSLFVRLSGGGSGKGAAGRWQDSASGEYGDLLDLIRESSGLTDFRDVAEEARRFLGLARSDNAPPVASADPEPNIAGDSEAVAARAQRSARRLFVMAQPLSGTLTETYLYRRGITSVALADNGSGALRFHPRCFYRADPDAQPETWPAMIAAVTDVNGTITGVHRTWLDPGGFHPIRLDKAPVETPRRALGHLLGHAVRFGLTTGIDVLAAGEGIETMLSLRCVLPTMPVNRHAKGTPYRRAKRTPLVRQFRLVQVANRRAPRARVARFNGAGGAGAWEVPVCPPGQAGHGRWNAGAAFRRGF